jgi:hypothetical protein
MSRGDRPTWPDSLRVLRARVRCSRPSFAGSRSLCSGASRPGGDEVREDLGCEVRRGVGVADGGVDDHGTPSDRRGPQPLAGRGRDRAAGHDR